MNWAQAYSGNSQPSLEEISLFINSPLWDEFCLFMNDTYSVSPRIEYSSCSMQRGWNVKYRKGGKSLCVLYPMEGYFIALIVLSEKTQVEIEAIMAVCSGYVRDMYKKAPYFHGSKWMMIDVKDAAALQDVKRLLALRGNPRP